MRMIGQPFSEVDEDLRAGNYTSSIADLDTILDGLSAAQPDVPYYFMLTLQNGTSKVFYFLLKTGEVPDTYVAEFYRDYTKYPQPGMSGYDDFLIKAYAPTEGAVMAAELPGPPVVQVVTTPVKDAMLNYIEVFIDAVQVISAMPY